MRTFVRPDSTSCWRDPEKVPGGVRRSTHIVATDIADPYGVDQELATRSCSLGGIDQDTGLALRSSSLVNKGASPFKICSATVRSSRCTCVVTSSP